MGRPDEALAEVQAAFRREFGADGAVFRAPGRINLIGEHTDYHDGLVMPLNTSLYTWLVARPRTDRMVQAHATLFGETASVNLDLLEPAGSGNWIEYVKGVLWAAQSAGHELRGVDLLIHGNIPLGGGLSSSASLEAVIACAALTLSGHQVDPTGMAQLCQRAENQFVGMQCGIMDQFVVSACPPGHAIVLDCRSLEFEPVALPAGLELLVINSGVRHQHSGGGYNQRREESEAALKSLLPGKPGATALRDFTPEDIELNRERLSELQFRRAMHVCTENQRVRQAQEALVAGDLPALGKLLNASHRSMAEDYEISCDAVDALVEIAQASPAVFGARMVGGGFGGCTVNLVRPGRMDEAVSDICERYGAVLGREPWHHVVRSAGPAGEVTV